MDLESPARRVLADLTGASEPLRARYLQPDRAVYLAEGAGIVLKVYAEADLLRRDWEATGAARAAGVPTAEPLAFVPGPPAVYAMRHVAGRPLSSRDGAAAREAGAALARFHRLGAKPPFATGALRWDEQVLAWAGRDLAGLGRSGVLAGDEIAALWGRFVAARDRFAARPVALLHGDLQPVHVLVAARGGRVVALLDFVDTQPGDPLHDLAVLTLWDAALTAPLLAGYATIPDDAATRALLADYRLLRQIGEVPWLLERDFAAYADRDIAAIRAALAGS